MAPDQIRMYAETATAVAGLLVILWSVWKYAWPMVIVRGFRVVGCFLGRVRVVWNTLEQMPELRVEYADMKAAVQDFGVVATLVRQVLAPDLPESVPARMAQLVDMSAAQSAQQRLQGEQMKAQGDQIGIVAAKVDTLSNTIRASQNTNPRLATFESDDVGRCIYVNKTYLRWSGLSLAETLGWGWMNAIAPEDRAVVRADWLQAISDARRFQRRYRMQSTDGTVFDVDCSAEPIPEGTTPAERWIGAIYRVTTGQPPP